MPEKSGEKFDISDTNYGKNGVKILYLSRNGEKLNDFFRNFTIVEN